MVVHARKNGPPPAPSTKNRHSMLVPRLINSRTSRKRRNHMSDSLQLLVARNECIDSKLRKGMRHLPTKQKSHTPRKNPHFPHPSHRRRPPLQSHSHGPNYSAPQKPRTQCYSNHSRSRLLSSCDLSPLSHNNHRRRSSPTIRQKCLPMVWTSHQSHI